MTAKTALVGRTPLPTIFWDAAHERWRFTFDVGQRLVDLDLHVNGTCEWFARNRADNTSVGIGTNHDPVPFAQVCNDPEFIAAMQAIKDEYDGLPAYRPAEATASEQCEACDGARIVVVTDGEHEPFETTCPLCTADNLPVKDNSHAPTMSERLASLPQKDLRQQCVAAQHAVGHLASLTLRCSDILRMLDRVEMTERELSSLCNDVREATSAPTTEAARDVVVRVVAERDELAEALRSILAMCADDEKDFVEALATIEDVARAALAKLEATPCHHVSASMVGPVMKVHGVQRRAWKVRRGEGMTVGTAHPEETKQ